MDITPYIESLRRDLRRRGGRRPRDPPGRGAPLRARPGRWLALMEAVSQAAAEITAEMPSGSVDVRLNGRELDFVLQGAPSAPPRPRRRPRRPPRRPRTRATSPGSRCGCPSRSRPGPRSWRPARATRSTPGWSTSSARRPARTRSTSTSTCPASRSSATRTLQRRQERPPPHDRLDLTTGPPHHQNTEGPAHPLAPRTSTPRSRDMTEYHFQTPQPVSLYVEIGRAPSG